MEPINEAEVSLQKSVQRDGKTKRDLVLSVLEDMKNNPDRGSNSAGKACETCPPLIREEFIDYLIKMLAENEIEEYEDYEPTTREYFFGIKHPIIAYNVGVVEQGSTNISTDAHRFASTGYEREGGLEYYLDEEEKIAEGTEVNAFRHTLWQAIISKEYGIEEARAIGNSHEENPSAYLNKNRVFRSLHSADEVIDLLNNQIGRVIGDNTSSESTRKDLANKVLDRFYNDGLYVAKKNEDNTYSVVIKKLIKKKYDYMKDHYKTLDDHGIPEK